MFNSEYCMVDFVESDNVTLLTWKKFSCKENYREPVRYALNLVREHIGCNFIIDARNGFEDEPSDVEWGFNEFMPNLAKTDCKYIVFIMNEVNEIEGEMDMWLKEFSKYFTIIRATFYDKAIEELNKYIKKVNLNVIYTIKDGLREKFYLELIRNEIVYKSRKELGNLVYNFYNDLENPNEILLVEEWLNTKSFEEHLQNENYKVLSKLKEQYVINVFIKRCLV